MGAQFCGPCMCCSTCNHQNCQSSYVNDSLFSDNITANNSSSARLYETGLIRKSHSMSCEEKLKQIEEDLIREKETNYELQRQLCESIDKLLDDMSTDSSIIYDTVSHDEEIKGVLNQIKFILNFYHRENLLNSKLCFVNIRHVASCVGCEKCALLSNCVAENPEKECIGCEKALQFHDALVKIENYCGITYKGTFQKKIGMCQKIKILTKRFKKVYSNFKNSMANKENTPSICSLSNISAITDISFQQSDKNKSVIGSICKSKFELAPYTLIESTLPGESPFMATCKKTHGSSSNQVGSSQSQLNILSPIKSSNESVARGTNEFIEICKKTKKLK